MEAIIDNFSTWIDETNPQALRETFSAMLTDSGFGLLNRMEHSFEPQGYTCLWLLSESHFAIHTFPEQNQTYIELSSCNREMYQEFIKRFAEYSNAKG